MSAVNLKYKDESWDFRESDTKEYTHCFHTYPAMMIPQIARKLLTEYGTENGWLLDSYCGTGTSLVEASLFGMHSVGCDINPLVRLIAAAKSTPICLQTLDETLSRLNDHLFQVESQESKIPDAPIPDILNLEYWFSEEVIRCLAYLRNWINKIGEETVRNFILVAFSETVREVSYTRNGEFKLYRMPPQKLDGFKPDVFGIFSKKLVRNRQGLAAFLEKRKSVEVSAFYVDLGCSINSIAQVLSPRATICYVVGNRRVKEVLLPTDEFVVDAFRQHGFTHKATIVRNIPNKRMPKKNSPSNIAGETSTTMHEENIVICQRTTHTCQ